MTRILPVFKEFLGKSHFKRNTQKMIEIYFTVYLVQGHFLYCHKKYFYSIVFDFEEITFSIKKLLIASL